MSNGHGGARPGAGRKPRDEEQKLIMKLEPHDDVAIAKLIELVNNSDFNAIKLFLEYRFGKPTQKVESDSSVHVSGINLADLVKFE